MKKFLLVFLSLLTAAQLVACSSPATGDTDTTASGVNTPTETTVPEETEAPGPTLEIEKKDYNGHTVTYLTAANYTNNFKLNVEESSAEKLSDAAFRRNLAVGELLNVKFASVEVAPNAVAATLQNSILAGGGDYDFILPHASEGVTAMMLNGSLEDWNKLPSVNFDNPWWSQGMIDAFAIDDKLFYTSGDLTMTWQGTGGYVFNKEVLEKNQLKTNMYEFVYDGSWTIDKMMEISKGMYSDLNGNSARDEGDQYSIMQNPGASRWVRQGLGITCFERDADGYPQLAVDSDRMMRAVEKYYELMYLNDTYAESFGSTTYVTSNYRKMLLEGRAFITYYDIGMYWSFMNEIPFEFGVLPMPKLDEIQQDYYTFCTSGIIGLPRLSPDLERSSDVIEALMYYSYEYVRPTFFDEVLQYKSFQDQDSYNMLTIIQENKIADVGYTYGSSADGALGQVVITNKSTDWVSYYDSFKDKDNKKMKELIDTVRAVYEELE